MMCHLLCCYTISQFRGFRPNSVSHPLVLKISMKLTSEEWTHVSKLSNLARIKWQSVANIHVCQKGVILSSHVSLQTSLRATVPFDLTWADLWSFARRWKCPRIKARETWVCRKHPEFCQHYNYCQAPGGIGKEGSVAIFLKGYKYCHIQLGWYKGWFFD